MTVFFAEDSSIIQIEATDNVVIKDGLRHANSESLLWHVPNQTLTFTGSPRLRTQNGFFSGGQITIFRKAEEIRCEKGCRLEIKAKEP